MLITRFITLIIIAMVISSCEDFISLKPRDAISTDDFWKTSKDLENYIMQLYNVFPVNAFDSNSGYPTDEMMNAGSINEIMNGSRTVPTGDWTNEWRNVRTVNVFLENYRNVNDDIVSWQQFLGEGYFFRAWFYFNLLKKYGKVPWFSKSINLDSNEDLLKSRDARNIVVDSILMDLDRAELFLNYRRNVGNSRLNKEVALAFKSRVALYEGTWQKYHADTPFGSLVSNAQKYFKACVDACEKLMNGDYLVGIYDSEDDSYYKLFGFSDMSDVNEILFYKAFNSDDNLSNTTQGYVSFNDAGKGVTWSLISTYLGKDGLPYDYINASNNYKGNLFLKHIAESCDPRLRNTIWIPGDLVSASQNLIYNKPPITEGFIKLCPTGFAVKKQSNPYNSAAGQSWQAPDETGQIFFRYGEVLLNYAEAKYELDNIIAYDQLNSLRSRVGMPEFSVNAQVSNFELISYGYKITDALYEIRRERQVELALEGFREDDLMRWAAHAIFSGKRPKGYPLDVSEFPDYVGDTTNIGLLDPFMNELPNGYQFSVDKDYLYPIPQNELVLNPNLIQNPGW